MRTTLNGLPNDWGVSRLVETAENLRGSMTQQLAAISSSPFGLDAVGLLGLDRTLKRSHQLIALASRIQSAENDSIRRVIDSIGR